MNVVDWTYDKTMLNQSINFIVMYVPAKRLSKFTVCYEPGHDSVMWCSSAQPVSRSRQSTNCGQRATLKADVMHASWL